MASDLPTATPIRMGNGMSGQVAISVNDDAPSHSNPKLFIYKGILYIWSLVYWFPLTAVRYGIMSQNDKELSPMEMNDLFMWMSFVALYVATLTTWILIICTSYLYKQMRNIHYTILKCIGLFSANIAFFSIWTVLIVPPSLNWIGFLLACVAFGFAFGICYLEHHYLSNDDDDHKFPITYTGLFYIPLLPVLVIFLPNNLNWIGYVVMYSYYVIELGCRCSLINSEKLSVIKEKNKVYDLEAPHQVTQQDKNIDQHRIHPCVD